jgi:hypothetical protein
MNPRLITCTEDLVEALRERREALGITHLEMDAKVGLTQGHTSKVEVPDAEWGKRPFQMLVTVDWMLKAIGLSLVIMRSDEADKLLDLERGTHRQARRSGRGKSITKQRRLAWVRTRKA